MADDDKAVFERCPAFNIECQYVTEVDRLSAENERLRERIERLRKALYAAYDDEPGWRDLTRAALGDTK